MLYAVNIIRLDIVKIASKLFEFLHNPLPIHNIFVIKAIAYLY